MIRIRTDSGLLVAEIHGDMATTTALRYLHSSTDTGDFRPDVYKRRVRFVAEKDMWLNGLGDLRVFIWKGYTFTVIKEEK